MAAIADLLAQGRTFSFEFFPPKTDEAARELEKAIGELQPLEPSFVSVTYGAGGSTRERTRDIVVGIQANNGITSMAHLTCIAHTREQLVSLLEEYQVAGITNILALAGDPPVGDDPYPTDLTFASELIELIRGVGDFSIGVAAHPELHPRSGGDRALDRRHLAAKLQAGDFGVTQFFFEAEHYLRMVDDLAAIGCTTPVLPGIMPVTNAGQIKRFAELAGAKFRTGWQSGSPRWRTIPPRCGRWGWRWRPNSARSCSTAARPGSTSTHSTGRRPLARSTTTSASPPDAPFPELDTPFVAPTTVRVPSSVASAAGLWAARQTGRMAPQRPTGHLVSWGTWLLPSPLVGPTPLRGRRDHAECRRFSQRVGQPDRRLRRSRGTGIDI